MSARAKKKSDVQQAVAEMTKKAARKRAWDLRDQVSHHDYLCHVLDDPQISDADYNELKRELMAIEERLYVVVGSNPGTTKTWSGETRVRRRRSTSLNEGR